MRKPESTFIASVHKHLPPNIYHMKLHNMYIGGPADVWYSGTADDLWVEYKYIEVPRKLDTIVQFGLTPLQLEWLGDRNNEGRNVAVIVGCEMGGVLIEYREWEMEWTADEFEHYCLSRENLADSISYRVSLASNHGQTKRNTTKGNTGKARKRK